MQQMKTYMARPGEIEPKWWLVDASDKVVGRLASELAMARTCEETEIEDLLNRALSKCKLRFPEASMIDS